MSSIVIALVAPLVLALLGAAVRTKARRDGDTYVVEYGRGFRVLAWGFVSLAAAVAFGAYFAKSGDRGYVFAIAGIFALLGAPLWLHAHLTRFVYGRTGICSRSPWRTATFIPWESIANVTYSRGEQSYVVTWQDGAKFKLHAYMAGVPDLVAELQRRDVRGALLAEATSRDVR